MAWAWKCRSRYYHPVSGRFTQEDPIGLAGGLNLYGFANGDPVNFSDPFGLCVPVNVCLAVAGGLIGGGGRLLSNALSGRPLLENVGRDALIGGAIGLTAGLAAPGLLNLASTAPAAAGGTAAATFQHGQRVKEFVETTGGRLEVAFKVTVDGANLHLSNFSVFGADANEVRVGTGQMLQLTRQLIDAARAQGFEQIRITGQRISGANPGHLFEVIKDLK